MYATNAFLKLPVAPPCTVFLDPPMSDEEFETLSEQCEFAVVERDRDGRIVVSAGSGPVEGFVLDLEEVWSCYE
jgi:hypothetical protein